ncbi:hypothetical protein [Deinococcus planocerae]|uniref:hypothetical protein n=1 Tax=Deinococcus planocerae TaxID=1737569 RepID=UPI000C7E9D08|nr:hypothetical protein [Deinococcus planocerae]
MKTALHAIRPYIPGLRDLLFSLGLLLVFFLFNQVAAQTIDGALGTNVTSKGCNFVKSVETSIALKVFCGGVVLWGIIKFIPTRKDGVGQMLAGVIGFLVVSKFTSFMSTFGMNC